MKKLLIIILIIVVILLILLIPYTNNLNKEKGNESLDQKYCEKDEDCACGINIYTKECFIGNKKFVNTSIQCPDFCTGFAGNIKIKCIENKCKAVQE